MNNKKQLVLSLTLASAALASPAFAQVDTAGIVDIFVAIGVTVGTIGTAVLAAKGVAIVVPWVSRMMNKGA